MLAGGDIVDQEHLAEGPGTQDLDDVECGEVNLRGGDVAQLLGKALCLLADLLFPAFNFFV